MTRNFAHRFDPNVEPDLSVEGWAARAFGALSVMATMDPNDTNITMDTISDVAASICSRAPTDVLTAAAALMEFIAQDRE